MATRLVSVIVAQLSLVAFGSDTEDHSAEDESDVWSPMTIAAAIFMAGAMTGIIMTAVISWCGRVCLKRLAEHRTYPRIEVDSDSGLTPTLRRRIRLSADISDGAILMTEVSGGAVSSAEENPVPRISREAPDQEARHALNPEGDPRLVQIVHLLNTYRVQDLKEGLRSKGLPISGIKGDLVQRLANGNVWPPQSLIDRVSDLARILSIRAPILAIMTVTAGEAWLTATQERIRI